MERALSEQTAGDPNALMTSQISYREMKELAGVLRDATLLSEGLIHSRSLYTGEWKAWCNMLSHRFRGLAAFANIIRFAEEQGEKYLPAQLHDLGEDPQALTENTAELALILPRFGRILKWLSVVGRMHAADEPLKPALLIFSRVNDQIFELTDYINGRLERFPDEEVELFASLDSASYTASIELKKVYSQEPAGLVDVRPSPSIYARIETAHSLLNDGFQQILAGFARLIDPESDICDLFPEFHVKRERSILLRTTLWDITRTVQAAERDPEKEQIESLHLALREFLSETVRYLFYNKAPKPSSASWKKFSSQKITRIWCRFFTGSGHIWKHCLARFPIVRSWKIIRSHRWSRVSHRGHRDLADFFFFREVIFLSVSSAAHLLTASAESPGVFEKERQNLPPRPQWLPAMP